MLLTEERVHERVTPKTDWRGIVFNPIPTQVAVLVSPITATRDGVFLQKSIKI